MILGNAVAAGAFVTGLAFARVGVGAFGAAAFVKLARCIARQGARDIFRKTLAGLVCEVGTVACFPIVDCAIAAFVGHRRRGWGDTNAVFAFGFAVCVICAVCVAGTAFGCRCYTNAVLAFGFAVCVIRAVCVTGTACGRRCYTDVELAFGFAIGVGCAIRISCAGGLG